MACVAKGEDCAVRCQTPKQLLRLRPSFMLVLFSAILTTNVCADCITKYTFCKCFGNGLYCFQMGDVSQIPPLHPSDSLYDIVIIGSTPALPTVQNYSFSGFNVKEIKLTQLGVIKIEPEAFIGLGEILEKITISFTKLQTLPDGLFNPVSHSLKYLYLNDNQLTTISSAIFRELKSLQILDLGANRLKTISDIFSSLINLSYASIRDNPFVCDCRLVWLRTSAIWRRSILVLNVVCFSPTELKGKIVTQYNISSCEVTTNSVTTLQTTVSKEVSTIVASITSKDTTADKTPNCSTEATTKTKDKDNTEHFVLIALGILSGLLTVALVITIVLLKKRKKWNMSPAISTVRKTYSYTSDDIYLTPVPVYNTIPIANDATLPPYQHQYDTIPVASDATLSS